MHSITIFLIFGVLLTFAYAEVVEQLEDGKTIIYGEGEEFQRGGKTASFVVPTTSCTLGHCLNICLTFMDPPLRAWCTGCCNCNCEPLESNLQ